MLIERCAKPPAFRPRKLSQSRFRPLTSMGDAIVRVWWFGKNIPGIAGFNRMAGIGHASVHVRPDEGSTTYLTWGLGQGANGFSGSSSSVAAGNNYSYEDDLQIYGGREDWSCVLPLRDARRVLSVGLDGHAMQAFWNELRLSTRGYKAISKTDNCDGVTVQGLIAGGADSYHEPPSNLFYQGATSLREWVLEVHNQMLVIGRTLPAAYSVLVPVRGNPPRPPEAAGGIWTVQQFKAATHVWIGSRNEQVAKIDQLLSQYHGQTQVRGAFGLAQRRVTLLRILHHIYLHLTLKPDSDRRGGVIQLGR